MVIVLEVGTVVLMVIGHSCGGSGGGESVSHTVAKVMVMGKWW